MLLVDRGRGTGVVLSATWVINAQPVLVINTLESATSECDRGPPFCTGICAVCALRIQTKHCICAVCLCATVCGCVNTGWALCGHEAAPGAAAGAEGGGEADAEDAEGGSGAAAAAAAVEAGGVGGSGNKSVSSSMTAGEVKQHPADGREECSCDAGDASGGSSSREQGVHTQQRQQGNAGRPGAWHPAQMLSHQQRIQLGLKCKQLLDAGRCAWLQKQLAPMLMSQQQQQQRGEVSEGAGRVGGELQVQRVAYIDPSITGENTLLLLGRCC